MCPPYSLDTTYNEISNLISNIRLHSMPEIVLTNRSIGITIHKAITVITISPFNPLSQCSGYHNTSYTIGVKGSL